MPIHVDVLLACYLAPSASLWLRAQEPLPLSLARPHPMPVLIDIVAAQKGIFRDQRLHKVIFCLAGYGRHITSLRGNHGAAPPLRSFPLRVVAHRYGFVASLFVPGLQPPAFFARASVAAHISPRRSRIFGIIPRAGGRLPVVMMVVAENDAHVLVPVVVLVWLTRRPVRVHHRPIPFARPHEHAFFLVVRAADARRELRGG